MTTGLPDLATGLAWLAVALLAIRGRGSFAALATAVAVLWLSAASVPILALWHRPVIVLLLLCTPRWWPRHRSSQVIVAATATAAVLIWPWTSPLGSGILGAAFVIGFRVERGRAGGLAWAACVTAAIAFTAPPLIWMVAPRGWSTPIGWAYDAALIAVAFLAYAQWRADRQSDPLDLLIELDSLETMPLDADERAAALRLDREHERLQRDLGTGISELRASRLRLTEASDRARAGLRAELAHDVRIPLRGLIQELAADSSSTHSAAARRHLEVAAAEVDAITLGLAPRAVASGLTSAVRELAAAAPLPVRVDADHLDLLLPGIVTTAYYVCAEALANVGRHAAATHAVVTLRQGADGLPS